MAPTSSSCQLYEGNFEDWRKRMNAIFMVQRRPRQLSPAGLYDPTIGGALDAACTPSEMQTVRRRISPTLLARLPEDVWSPAPSLATLYKQLESLCQPFRLMDLPAELRVRIYEQVVDEHEITKHGTDKPWTITSSHRLLALAQTSQQLRQEVSPIYFSTANFSMTIDMDAYDEYLGRGYTSTLQKLALRWSRNFVGAYARHLRRLTLNLTVLQLEPDKSMEWPRITLNLLFSKTKGYRVEYHDKLSTRSKEQLENHVRFVNKKCENLRMSGEAIVVALVEEYHMWDFTNLCIGEDLY